MSGLNTNIVAPRVPLVDANGYMNREWYAFFLNLFNRTGGITIGDFDPMDSAQDPVMVPPGFEESAEPMPPTWPSIEDAGVFVDFSNLIGRLEALESAPAGNSIGVQLGSIASQSANAVAITGGTISGLSSLATVGNASFVNGTVTAGATGVVLIGRYSNAYPTGATVGYFSLETNNSDANNGGLTIKTLSAGALTSRVVLTNAGAAFTGTLTSSAGFGCNGATAQTAYASGGAVATTAATSTTPYGFTTAAQADGIVSLLNKIRSALVANGIMS